MYSSYSVAAAVCSVVFPFFASLAVGMRLRARNIKSLSYKTDDYVILLALVGQCSVPISNNMLIQYFQCLSISNGGTILYGSSKTGYGQKLSTMTPAEYSVYGRVFRSLVARIKV